MSKKYKSFAFFTLVVALLFLIFDNTLNSKGLGLRNLYYNISISILVYPILILMTWTAFIVYHKHFKKKLFTKIWSLVFMPIILLGLTFVFTLTIFTSKEEVVVIDGISYVYSSVQSPEGVFIPNVYYEVVDDYFHKVPYAMIDVDPTKP